jgi:uncharacterized protein (TIGR00159 family)
MLELATAYFEGRTGTEVARDVFDIFIVYYVTYRLLLVARGTRAIQIAAGLGIVALLYVVAQQFELVTIVTLVGAVLQSIILVIVVVFQNDIRRALQRVGSRAFFGGARAQETHVIEQVVEAATELARHRIGAIITFEQDANLDEFTGQNKGIALDAKVSSELLVSLFIPEGSNKLHDGAVILRNLRVAKAGVFFPMPEGRSFESRFGSRHRAAVGITEETDAVVVVVSEERGTISFCFNGNIAPDLQPAQLREMLLSIMSPKATTARKKLPSESRESTDRVTIRSAEPEKPQSAEETPPPPSTKPPASEETPKPLRKSGVPDQSQAVEDTDSMKVAVSKPRPMPKASEVEAQPDSDDAPDAQRSTPQ